MAPYMVEMQHKGSKQLKNNHSSSTGRIQHISSEGFQHNSPDRNMNRSIKDDTSPIRSSGRKLVPIKQESLEYLASKNN